MNQRKQKGDYQLGQKAGMERKVGGGEKGDVASPLPDTSKVPQALLLPSHCIPLNQHKLLQKSAQLSSH